MLGRHLVFPGLTLRTFLFCSFIWKGTDEMIIDKDLLKNGAAVFGIELDETALDRFDEYAELIIETNKVMNLTSILEPKDIVVKHFLDSLSLFSAIQLAKGAKVIDVGTG